ncbi:nuclear RNA binding protein, putative [Talaromyces marneffei ATCC 18224]|uniref:Nuclear RNA binding protein, putative n=1 Tax=Talaromyces marneffei (strain ATCC 18224 / CBS 334.59 / QM 7333) TaxID=441960 RepID=B6Q8E3_TALMQ|nr:nuclear RNA binding protein, putative [Talaromyces marneffei ATCC 18224]
MGDDAENSRPSYYYTPYIDIELQFDPLQADPLIQKSLVLEDSNSGDDSDNQSGDNLEGDATSTDTDNDYRDAYGCHHDRHGYGYQRFSMTTTTATSTAWNSLNKRKVAPADYSDATSDTSGRFDDADESDDVMQLEPPPPVVAEEKMEDNKSVHSAKRGRSNGWPFQNEIAYDENGMKIDLSERRNTATPGKVLRIRRSRFIEGSMNDRVSEKPPSIYFQEDRNKNNEDVTQQGVGATAENKKLEKRSSGIFRFGKAIASAFHPFGGGGGSKSATKSEQDALAKSQKEIMKQRQLKAEKAYAELKKSGYKGTLINPNANFSKNQVDGGIADETWKSIQEKMGYKLADENRISQDDTLVGVPGDGLGPMSPERGVSKFKSFSELRKRTPNLSIPALRFRDVSPLSMRSSMERDIEYDNHAHQPIERRQSRKELHKQAKLLKRVSNLEDKLERARRELREYVPGNNENQQMPVPIICIDDEHDRQFSSGTLPTVLSERLLEAGYVQGGMQGTSQRTAKWPPVDSLSRKRKSPVPMAVDMVQNTDDLDEYDANCGKPMDEEDSGKTPLRNKLKPTRDKRASSLTTKASQRLKAKQASRNLRAVANDSTPTEEEEEEEEGNTSTTTTTATPTSSAQKKSREWTHYGSDYENIPPVPPVPKELLTCKSPSKEKSILSAMKARIPSKEFSWPEDIF